MKKVLIILILAVLIRLMGINQTYYEDEMILSTIAPIDTHPPLGFLMFKAAQLALGDHVIIARLISMIFGILTIILIYSFTKRYWNKRIALISTSLMAFAYHSIFISLVIAIDPIFMFFTSLAIYSIFLYGENEIRIEWVGIIIGLCLLIKYPAILLYPFFFLIVLSQKRISKTIKEIIKIIIISSIVFSIFPVYAYFTDWTMFTTTIQFLMTFGDKTQFLPFGTPLILLYLWSTPLLIGLTIIYFLRIKDKNKMKLGIWILFNLLFNLIVVKHGDYSRYLSVILPTLCICSANVMAQIRWTKHRAPILSLLTLFFVIIFHLINYVTINSVKRLTQSPSNYINEVLNLKFNFFFPYVVDHGSWFGTNFWNIIIISIIFSCFLITLILKNKRVITAGLLFLICSGAAYNLFLNNEYLVHLSQPNPDYAIKQAKEYFYEQNLSKPLYTTNKGIICLFKKAQIQSPSESYNLPLRIDNLTLFDQKIQKYGGTIVYIDFSTNFLKEQIITHPNCKMDKIIYSKEYPIGYILSCKSNNRN